MADFLQAQITLQHVYSQKKPTESEKTTKIDDTDDLTKNKKSDSKGDPNDNFKDWLASTSVKRRVANMSLSAVQQVVNYHYNNRVFRQNLYGNTRGATLLQNEKNNINAVSGVIKQGVGGAITSFALQNPIVMVLTIGQMLTEMGKVFIDYQQQLKQYNEQRNKALFEAQYIKNRLVYSSYNRRK